MGLIEKTYVKIQIFKNETKLVLQQRRRDSWIHNQCLPGTIVSTKDSLVTYE